MTAPTTFDTETDTDTDTAGRTDGEAVAALPKLRSHAFHAPTPADVHRLLSAGGIDDAAELWREACQELEITACDEALTLAELEQVTATMARRGGVVGLLARSVGVRMAAYREIAARGAGMASPTWDWARRALDELIRSRVPNQSRLEEIVDIDPFAPELRPDLDQVAARLAQRTGAHLAGVTVLLEGSQVLIGQHGFPEWVQEAGGTPAEWNFCTTIRRTGEPYVVPDAERDIVQRLNPAVLHEGAKSYAGVPLTTSRGQVIGTCCVIDVEARDFTGEHLQVLTEEADAVMATLEARRTARHRREARWSSEPTGSDDA